MSELQEVRHKFILESLKSNNSITITGAAKKLNVSEMTIRRDIMMLNEQGLLKRVHGGAVNAEQTRFGERLTVQKPSKRKATKKLEIYIPKSGIIYLDGSTTMLNLIASLATCKNLQVATNNIETFHKLAGYNRVEPILIGGKLDRRTDNIVGSLAMRSINAIVFDAAFFSSWGIEPKLGLMEVTLDDAEVKDLVATRSREVYVAIDESKFGRAGAGTWMPDKDKSILATNLPKTNKEIKPYKKLFSKIL